MRLGSQIIQLKREQLDIAGQVLARSFQNDPFYKYVIPDYEKREKALRWLMKKVILYTTLYGKAYVTPNIEGVACWLAPGATELTAYRIIRTGLPAIVFRFGLGAYGRFNDNMSYAGKIHKTSMKERHWYLWAIGVDPQYWGKGIGSCLIQPMLALADASGIPCYLETHNEKNIRFYEKHGFKLIKEAKAPKHDLRMWAMRRARSSPLQ